MKKTTLNEEIVRIKSLYSFYDKDDLVSEQFKPLGKFSDDVLKSIKKTIKYVPLNKITSPMDVLNFFSKYKNLWKEVNKGYNVDKIETLIKDIINGKQNPFENYLERDYPAYTLIPIEGNLRHNTIEAWRVKNNISDNEISKYIYKAKDKTNLPPQRKPVLGSDLSKVDASNIPKLNRATFGNWFNAWYEQFRVVKEVFKPTTIEAATKKFDELTKGGLEKYLNGGEQADINIFYQSINKAFFEMGRIFAKDTSLYDDAWKSFKQNIKTQYTGENLLKVEKFLKDLEAFNGGDSTRSIQDAITQIAGKNESAVWVDKFEVFLRKTIARNLDKQIKITFRNVLGSWWKTIVNYFTYGLFSTPKDVIKFFISKGYNKKEILKSMAVKWFANFFVAPLFGAGIESIFDGAMMLLYESLPDSENKMINGFKSAVYELIGEEAETGKSFEDYYMEWSGSGIYIKEIEGNSLLDGVNRIIPGFMDDLIVEVTSDIYNIGKTLMGKSETGVTVPTVVGSGEDTIDSNYLQKVTDISEPISLKIPFGESDTAYEDLDVKIQKLNNGESLDGYDTLSKYFRFKSLEEKDTYYFFFKNDPNKKLKLVRHTDYSEDGEHATGTHFTAKDETGKEYKNNEMVTFTKHLLDLINNDNILSIEEYDKMILESPKEVKELIKKKLSGLKGESLNKTTDNILKEMNEGKKFGEDNFKHWKDTFKFKKYDEKTNQLKDVKITAKMDEIMDRIGHFRKKYDEDDSFVRAVIDVYGTGIDIIQYTKGLAHLTEGVIVGGLLGVLSTIRESKELVTWTVKHYKDGNWELVKGNFNKKELLNVGKTKRERDERQKETDNPAEGLKKKEQESIMILSRDEKEGLNGLPTKVKQKVKEKLRQGWTTEKPFDFLNTYYSESEINSVFNDKIKIYKLKPSAEFFRTLAKNSSKVTVKKGFCKSVKNAKGEYDLSEREKNTLNHFISKCESKFGV
jgi:hypothetical protein